MQRDQVIALLQKKIVVSCVDSQSDTSTSLDWLPVGRGKKDSDVDILVEHEPDAHAGLFQFVRLRRELSNILGCAVDLATPDSLHKELREDILKEAVYAA